MMKRLDEKEIRRLLAERGTEGIDVGVFDTLDSTNTEAKRRIRGGLQQAALILAETQTTGRGRLGRSFYSPEGTGIYMTLATPWEADGDRILSVTGKTAVAVLRGLQCSLNAALSIKWVNDIYFGDKKICGILAEAVQVPEETGLRMWLVIGIGINVSTMDFPEELREKAGSLGAENCDRNVLVSDIVTELLGELSDLDDRSYLKTYRRCSNVLGREILYGTSPDFSKGFAEEIDDEGALIVRKEDGSKERLFTGEISVRFEKADCESLRMD